MAEAKVKYVPAGQFKAKCLALMDKVKADKMVLVITKHNKPVVKVSPVSLSAQKKSKIFGCMRGSVEVTGDIISPVDVSWDALADE